MSVAYLVRQNQSGFTLISALMGVLIVGITSSALVSMITYQHREVNHIKRQLTSASLKYFIIQNIKNINRCDCHFAQDPTDVDPNNVNLGPFTIDTTLPDGTDIPDINLGSVRSGCDFTRIDNIIARTGDPLPGTALNVESVAVRSISLTDTPAEYRGKLTLDYEGGTWAQRIRPIEIDLLFAVDGAAGTPRARPIRGCGPVVASAYQDDPVVVVATLSMPQVCSGQTGPVMLYGPANTDCTGAGSSYSELSGLIVSCPPGWFPANYQTTQVSRAGTYFHSPNPRTLACSGCQPFLAVTCVAPITI